MIVHILTYLIPFGIFVFTAVFLSLMQAEIARDVKNTITIVNGKIKQSKAKSLFNINEKIHALKRLGIFESHPSFEQPVYYIFMHIILGLVGGMLFYVLFGELYWSPIGFIVGYKGLDFYFTYKNKADNEEIQQDVLLIANILYQQIRGGVYIASAFTECEQSVQNKRLKKAMQEFNRQILLHEKTLLEALDEFESKFDSDDVSAICSTIRQGEETGKVQDIILDLNKQITDMENISNEALKQKMDRAQTLVVMLLFADILGFILYVAFSTILMQI